MRGSSVDLIFNSQLKINLQRFGLARKNFKKISRSFTYETNFSLQGSSLSGIFPVDDDFLAFGDLSGQRAGFI
jgi:hypothetical protein